MMSAANQSLENDSPLPRGSAAIPGWLAIAFQLLVVGSLLALILWLGLQPGSGTLPDPWPSLLGSDEARQAILNSLLFATAASLAANSLALPLAYLIAVRRGALGRATLAVAVVLWLLDPALRVLGWMQGIRIVGGIDMAPDILLSGAVPEFLAVLHAWLPAAAVLQAFAFLHTDRSMIEAARECGASAIGLVFRLVLPLNLHAILFSLAAVFAGSIGSFLEPRLLGFGNLQQASEWIQRALESETGWPYAAVMLALMLALGALPVLASTKYKGGRE